ncbi:uncharacterized protein CTRU02_214267 [Colletotrichum truncatum]|uniref:Uncharacterized protein n=1 Tax=Colletotrichum truncatum TaxID=5467 RepID=A0ACC3YJZ3_COLTU|nr:uncharacterized protein CTRU02_11340 [Colletotrichum truncatum]KAF6786082.1 hypothetical protein CTRU02_11340 [Colletotrichum truncatum]
MAPQQNTFSVISHPAPRGGGAPSKPPMTSKQAQKLYKQANKGPRLSKAEQRKWEKERQEEIRKELEKERAAAKARQARERKKAKEDEARENKRRNGQPLINCRPSQDTIARFVRGNGTSRKRDSSGEPIPKPEEPHVESPETKPSALGPPSDASPSKSLRHVSSQENKMAAALMPPPPPPSRPSQKAVSAASVPRSSQFKVPAVPKADSDAQVPRAPPILKAPVTASTQSRTVPSVTLGPPLKAPTKAKPRPFMMPKGIVSVQPPARKTPIKQEAVVKKSVQQESSKQLPAEPKPTAQTPADQKMPEQRQVKEGQQEPAIEQPQMPPPPKPSPQVVAPQRPPSVMPPPQLSRSQMPPKASMPQAPPPSTQAIIQDCFDDFFPTASQLALELQDDSSDDDSQRVVEEPPQKHKSAEHSHEIGSIQAGQQRVMKDPLVKEDQLLRDSRTGGHSKAPDTKLSNPLSIRHSPRKSNMTPKFPLPPKPTTRSIDNENRNRQHGYAGPHSRPSPGVRSVSPKPRSMASHIHKTTTTPRDQPQNRMATAHTPKTSHRGILHEISGNRAPEVKRPTTTKPVSHFDDFFPLICTQDLMMSSQEVQDIESPAKMDSQPSSEESFGGLTSQTSPLNEMDLTAIDWDDDLDDF